MPLRPSTSSNAHRLLSQNGLVHDGDDGDVVAVAVALAVDVDVDVVPASVAVVVVVAAFAVAVAVAVAVVARCFSFFFFFLSGRNCKPRRTPARGKPHSVPQLRCALSNEATN